MPKRKHDDNTENGDTQNCLSHILKSLATDDDAFAKRLCESIRTLENGTPALVRALHAEWNIESGPERNRRKGCLADIRKDLQQKLKERGAQYMKEHCTSLRAHNDGSSQGKQPRQQFELDKALAETAKKLKSVCIGKRMMIRVIDHAWSSSACISQLTANMMEALSWDVNADFSGDQPLDACGYIAADAVSALRQAALAKCNSWFDIELRNYASLDCVERGNKVLRRQEQDRVLFGDDINDLVRTYSGIDQRRQAWPPYVSGYLVAIQLADPSTAASGVG